MTHIQKKWAMAIGFAFIGLISFFVIADSEMMKNLTKDIVTALDAKKITVVSLATASTAASFAITAIPGDVGMPVAENFADLSDYLILVFGAIWLQKYLIGITGFVAFKVILPVVSFVLAANVFLEKGALTILAKKLFLFGAVFFALIPTSVSISNHIEATHSQSAEIAIKNVEESQKAIEESEEDKGWFDNVTEFVGNLAGDIVAKFQVAMSNMIDAVAVLIITTCVIPILVVLFFLWATKLIFGLDFSPRIPKVGLTRRGQGKISGMKQQSLDA